MFDRQQLKTLAAIVQEGSFERAAQHLHISRGAVSQRIKALEEATSAVLLLREQPVRATAAGEVLLRHVKTLSLLEEEALREMQPQVEVDELVPLAIAVNADSLATWLPDVLWRVINTQGITLDVVRDDQEHTLERLLQGDVMGCVSSQRTSLRGFTSHPLGVMAYRCYAAPSFARRWFPDGLTHHAALKAPAALFDRKDTLHDRFLEQCLGVRTPRYPRHYLPDPDALLAAVQHGAGYGVLPCLQVALANRDTTAGTDALVGLAPEQCIHVPLYWHTGRIGSALARMLTDHLRQQAALSLEPFPSATRSDDADALRHVDGGE